MPKSHGPRSGTREKLSNDPRERGTSPPQRAVQEFDVGTKVHLSIDPSIPDGRFHPRFDGLTGEIVGEQGSAYQVAIKDGDSDKTVIAAAAHLRPQQE